MSKAICILGGADMSNDEKFRSAAYELGKALADRKFNVTCGGTQGLPECVARVANTGGSEVCRFILEGENTSTPVVGNIIKVSSMTDRMSGMLHSSDAFIALPGGLSALEEIFTIISWADKDYHKKPLGFLNVNGFYDGILSYLDQVVGQGCMTIATRNILMSAPTAKLLLNQLQPVPVEPAPENPRGSDDGEPDTTLRL